MTYGIYHHNEHGQLTCDLCGQLIKAGSGRYPTPFGMVQHARKHVREGLLVESSHGHGRSHHLRFERVEAA